MPPIWGQFEIFQLLEVSKNRPAYIFVQTFFSKMCVGVAIIELMISP